MTDKRFMVIHLGNAFDFVVKDIVENKTYGTFQGDGESMKKFCDDLEELSDENERIKNIINEAYNTERTQIGQNVLKQIMEQL